VPRGRPVSTTRSIASEGKHDVAQIILFGQLLPAQPLLILQALPLAA